MKFLDLFRKTLDNPDKNNKENIWFIRGFFTAFFVGVFVGTPLLVISQLIREFVLMPGLLLGVIILLAFLPWLLFFLWKRDAFFTFCVNYAILLSAEKDELKRLKEMFKNEPKS